MYLPIMFICTTSDVPKASNFSRRQVQYIAMPSVGIIPMLLRHKLGQFPHKVIFRVKYHN